VTVGETLTEARSLAGLSVEELSERTRIRGTVIRSIEEDDFEACGGDLYVRGYVRAIAGAVGIDAQPLIREYDLGRAVGAAERANGSTGRPARGYPAAPPLAAETSVDLPAILATAPAPQSPAAPGDQNATRYDMPVVAADPAATSYDLPRVPDPAGTAELPAAQLPTPEFPAADYPAAAFAAPVPPLLVPPPAAVPPGAAQTRYDLTPVPAGPVPADPVPADPVPADGASAELDDLMAAGYDLAPAGASASTDSGTQIIPAIGAGQAPGEATAAWPAPGPGRAGSDPAGAGRKRRRGLVAVAAAVVLVAAAALGITLTTGTGGTAKPASAAGVPSANASAAAARASASASAAAASASAAARASASAAAQASAAAAAKARAAALAARVVSLPVASVTAFGAGGAGDGDDPGEAADAIAANPSQPWATQWYATAEFGLLKHGTGLLLDLAGQVRVTTVRLDLSPYPGADLQLRVGNSAALPDLKVAATASNAGGTLTLALRHPVAARYLLIWITQLPPDGAGHYQETVSHVAVAGHR
jgi:hypothetical protein